MWGLGDLHFGSPDCQRYTFAANVVVECVHSCSQWIISAEELWANSADRFPRVRVKDLDCCRHIKPEQSSHS